MAVIDADLELIHTAGWNFPPELWATLSDYEKKFAVLEFSGLRTPNYYRARLDTLGFTKRGRVLDAACGMGQWAIGLTQLGNQVEGIDLMESRITVAKALSTANDQSYQMHCGSIEELPYANGSFDGVFCYGAFMFTDMPRTLHEFARVLKPGGRLYLNGNTWGWYAHLILDRGLKAGNFSLIRAALRMIVRTFAGRSTQVVITEGWLRKRLQETSFSIIALGTEGCVSLKPNQSDLPPPAYPQVFYGMRSIIELVAERTA